MSKPTQDVVRLLRFVQAIPIKPRMYPDVVRSTPIQQALDAGLVETDMSGTLRLTPAGKKALEEEKK